MSIENDLSELTALIDPAALRSPDPDESLYEPYSSQLALLFRAVAVLVDGKRLSSLMVRSRALIPVSDLRRPVMPHHGMVVAEIYSKGMTTQHGVILHQLPSKTLESTLSPERLAALRTDSSRFLATTPAVYWVGIFPSGLRVYPAVCFRQAQSPRLDDYPSIGFPVFIRQLFAGFIGDQLINGVRELRALHLHRQEESEMVLFLTAMQIPSTEGDES
jgi:hypothetical protein